MHSCTRNSLDEDGNGVLDQEEFARYQEVLEEQALEHKAIFDRVCVCVCVCVCAL